MKWRISAVCCAVSLVFASTNRLLAGDYSGTTGFSFLNLPVGARATALGQAFTSVPNDVQGVAYNPACLATMAASQLSFQHLTYVEDVDSGSAGLWPCRAR